VENIVTPGEELGTEEEFVCGEGTYAEEGRVLSSRVGVVQVQNRNLAVAAKTTLSPLHLGAVAYGRIEDIIEPIALVSIELIPSGNLRYALMPDYCVIHASQIKHGFVRNVRDEFRIRDIIKAKIVEINETGVRITTDAPDLGVVKAFCTRCRQPLRARGGWLLCGNCGSKETRKLSTEFISV